MKVLIAKFGPGTEAASGSDTVPLQHWRYLPEFIGHDEIGLLAGMNFYTDLKPWDGGYSFISRNGRIDDPATYQNPDELLNLLIDKSPGIFHTHTRGKNIVRLAEELKKRGTKIVHTMHGMDSLHDEYDHRLFDLADVITSPSPYACRQIKELDGGRYKGKVIPLPNATDFSDYKWDPHVNKRADELRKRYLSDGERMILITGRLQEDKGIYELGEAVAQLIEEGEKLVLMHAGMVFDQRDEERLRDIFRSRGIEDKLVLYGKVEASSNPRELAAVYWASDIFAMPSDGTYENFPMSVLEALALEKPSIVSNIGGPFEVYVKPGFAIGVPPRDVEANKTALRYVIGNYGHEKERARTASRIIENLYHSRVVTGYLNGIYNLATRR